MKIEDVKNVLETAHEKSDSQLSMELDAIEVVLDFNTAGLSMVEYNYLRATRFLILQILDDRV